MWTGVVKFSVEKIHITSLRWMLEWSGGLDLEIVIPVRMWMSWRWRMLEGELVFSAWCGYRNVSCGFGI